MRVLLGAMLIFVAPACTGGEPDDNGAAKVDASGKVPVSLDQVPDGVLNAVKQWAPGLKILEVETETRNSVRYYDVAGTNAGGSEMELDVMQDGASWRVVETQRDIEFSAVPTAVRSAALSNDPTIRPSRVIESRQEGGLIIYELFSPEGTDPQGRKVEVRWDGAEAKLLAQEWAH